MCHWVSITSRDARKGRIYFRRFVCWRTPFTYCYVILYYNTVYNRLKCTRQNKAGATGDTFLFQSHYTVSFRINMISFFEAPNSSLALYSGLRFISDLRSIQEVLCYKALKWHGADVWFATIQTSGRVGFATAPGKTFSGVCFLTGQNLRRRDSRRSWMNGWYGRSMASIPKSMLYIIWSRVLYICWIYILSSNVLVFQAMAEIGGHSENFIVLS